MTRISSCALYTQTWSGDGEAVTCVRRWACPCLGPQPLPGRAWAPSPPPSPDRDRRLSDPPSAAGWGCRPVGPRCVFSRSRAWTQDPLCSERGRLSPLRGLECLGGTVMSVVFRGKAVSTVEEVMSKPRDRSVTGRHVCTFLAAAPVFPSVEAVGCHVLGLCPPWSSL